MPETKVELKVGERQLWVRFSLGALAEAQRAGGYKTLADLLGAYDELVRAFTAVGVGKEADPKDSDPLAFYRFDLASVRALLWGGTLEAQDVTGGRDTPEELLARVEFSAIGETLVALTSAMGRAFRGPQVAKVEAASGTASSDPPQPEATAQAA